ncbi:cold shock domain-containing protein [Mycobacterium sp. CBMA293]|uniref:cold-shock protein n=1 Tax=unclassified Mycolicibacterium TaxID=2636767 RepID=UPI0012DD2284|nr:MULTISPECIES: cold shock domain-containing protein [unclassified Mycolicibacterium]MUL47117.1 cold shock domain-containing protein [Mycolicibacterium sp. CBMA 360]MUL58494.1 cold shock domain-containing protein [Mycolicibacterium sp. CBMA 335]MUL73952.1 cold shock domain-containing protein [Mycolicibacterium sp. CBMA 311]MUL93377.1 cold shock domain-containing protein [Mycolicibacterium sp. CBMA 230]MUM04592.1 hypothetical protein [Mycolicibacterium sp. CBMA 213]
MNSACDIDVKSAAENAQRNAEEPPMSDAGDTVGRGAVMWFNPKFGIGYVRPDSGGPNLFVSAQDLVEGCRRLVRGRRVDYAIARTAHRARAIAVREIQ